MGGADHALGPQVDEHRHLSERCVTPGLRLPIFLGKTHLGAPSFGRVRSLKEWKIQAGDLGHRLARDRLEVSNHSDGRLDDGYISVLRFDHCRVMNLRSLSRSSRMSLNFSMTASTRCLNFVPVRWW